MEMSTQNLPAKVPNRSISLFGSLRHSLKPSSLNFDLYHLVSMITPWVAPIPSAFFVARSAMSHLGAPLAIAVILASAIELLGLTSVHTWLRLSTWNLNKRKSDPKAPTHLAVLLTVLYFGMTLGMITVMEVIPGISHFMPAITPFLTVIGALNLALLAQQNQLESTVRLERETRKTERSKKREERSVNGQQEEGQNVQASTNQGRKVRSIPETKGEEQGQFVQKLTSEEALTALVTFFEQNPTGSYSAAGRAAGRSKSWVVWALNELEASGRITKGGGKGISIRDINTPE